MPIQATDPQIVETFSPPYLRGDGSCDVLVETWVLGFGQTEWKKRGERPESLSPADVAEVLGSQPPADMSIGDGLGQRILEKLAANGQILIGQYIAVEPWKAAAAPAPAPAPAPSNERGGQ